MANEEVVSKAKKPSVLFGLITMLLIIATLMLGILVFGLDEHLLLFFCVVIISVASIFLGFTWDEIMSGMVKGLAKAMPALFFFFLIGMAVGAWIQCGTLPALIYYGMNILSPGWFLPASLIICSITSLATGSSWTTAGTVGVVLMGISVPMGLPAPLVAGCIISGAYFGDKMSPLSDTTNLAPAIAGTDVFSHIAGMLYTTIPAYVIAFIMYLVTGLKYAGTTIDTQQIAQIQGAISSIFDVNIVLLLPLLVVLILSVCRFPAIPSLVAGILLAYPLAAIYQGVGFADYLLVLNYGNELESGMDIVNELLNRGGIQGMMWTFSLAVLALALGGAISKSGVMQVLIEKLISKVKNPRLYPGMTILTGIFGCACLGEQYMSIVLTAELYKDAYPQAGLEPRMLSRCVEESSTLTANLFPWTTGGAFMFGALGIAAFQYGPYAFLNWITPIIGILLPLTGYSLLTLDKAAAKKAAKAAKIAKP